MYKNITIISIRFIAYRFRMYWTRLSFDIRYPIYTTSGHAGGVSHGARVRERLMD